MNLPHLAALVLAAPTPSPHRVRPPHDGATVSSRVPGGPDSTAAGLQAALAPVRGARSTPSLSEPRGAFVRAGSRVGVAGLAGPADTSRAAPDWGMTDKRLRA